MILYNIAPFVAIHFVGGGIHKMDTVASHWPHTVSPYLNYDEIGLQVKILKFMYSLDKNSSNTHQMFHFACHIKILRGTQYITTQL